ncbi:MAG: hypothetical protein ACTS6G_01175 [Candidatus Hodgkinia cicadicola]
MKTLWTAPVVNCSPKDKSIVNVKLNPESTKGIKKLTKVGSDKEIRLAIMLLSFMVN